MIPEIIFTTVTTLLVYRFFLFIAESWKSGCKGEILPLFNDLLEYLKELVKKTVTSRLFVISLVFLLLYGILVGACLCFRLCGAKEYQAEYIELPKGNQNGQHKR